MNDRSMKIRIEPSQVTIPSPKGKLLGNFGNDDRKS